MATVKLTEPPSKTKLRHPAGLLPEGDFGNVGVHGLFIYLCFFIFEIYSYMMLICCFLKNCFRQKKKDASNRSSKKEDEGG